MVQGMRCRLAPHHYQIYLQAAWASLRGLAVVRLWRSRLTPLQVLAALAGLIGLFSKPENADLRRRASRQPDLILDQAAHD